MKTSQEKKKYHELMDQACMAMIDAAKVRERADLTDGQKYELWKRLTRRSVALHNQAVACWKALHGSDGAMPTLTAGD
jgi:hypothetical protein